MEDRLLVAALRSRDPAAVGAVYDDYADRLYGYCWFQLRNGDAAQLAFRDALMCAEVHIRELRTPAKVGPWLYALARVECRRRRSAEPIHPDLPVARHDQDDADLRLMAWQAVNALPPLSRELLDLRYRHGLVESDIGLVTGLPAREAEELLGQARVLLEAALIAEVLAHEGPFACPDRVAILRRRTGEIDDDQREMLVRHSLECRLCSRHLPDAISPAKVYTLLPHAEPPAALREQVMSCFTDPEMAGYRLFASARVSAFGVHGFPVQPGMGRMSGRHRGRRRWPRAMAALTGALIAAVTASVVCCWFGEDASRDSGGIFVGPPGARAPLPSPSPPGWRRAVARPISATFPIGPRVPAVAMGETNPAHVLPGPAAGRLSVSPGHLTLGPHGTGTLLVHAMAGGVGWQAHAAGPVRLAAGGGDLRPGATETVAVQAMSGRPGSAVITFQPGGARVFVSWGRPPSSPPKTPPPSTPPPSTPPPSTPPPSTPPATPTPTPTPTSPGPTPPADQPPSTPPSTSAPTRPPSTPPAPSAPDDPPAGSASAAP